MSGMQGNVTLPISEFLEFKNKIGTAENEIAELRKQLGAARLEDPSGRVPGLVATIRTIMEVAQFAIANLPPETRGWPDSALISLAKGVESLPDVTTAEIEMALDMVAFASECAEVTQARADRAHAQRASERAELGLPTSPANS